MKEFKPADKLNSVGEYYFSKKNAEIAQLRSEGHEIVSLVALDAVRHASHVK